MDERTRGLISDVTITAHIVAVVLVLSNIPLMLEFWRSGTPSAWLGLIGLVVGAYGIAIAVRLANHRADPRHTKRPPDPP